ncbi:MAG: DUF1320 domain-containing protein [Geobacteraceae bacterium]|nr:DUF1320 domain-containing protein [Geobacteraceae bacterium]
MPYCTFDDIRTQLPPDVLTALTDDSLAGTADWAVLADAIADADAEIDAWAGGRYAVPFSPVPDVIRKIAADIAIYNLFSRRDTDPPDVRKDRYRNAVKLLESIAKGTVSIGRAENSAQKDAGDCPRAAAPDPVFSRESLERF